MYCTIIHLWFHFKPIQGLIKYVLISSIGMTNNAYIDSKNTEIMSHNILKTHVIKEKYLGLYV